MCTLIAFIEGTYTVSLHKSLTVGAKTCHLKNHTLSTWRPGDSQLCTLIIIAFYRIRIAIVNGTTSGVDENWFQLSTLQYLITEAKKWTKKNCALSNIQTTHQWQQSCHSLWSATSVLPPKMFGTVTPLTHTQITMFFFERLKYKCYTPVVSCISPQLHVWWQMNGEINDSIFLLMSLGLTLFSII